jgi:hypothetical protein
MAKRTVDQYKALLAKRKSFKPSEWKSWPVVKPADAETGQVRRDPSGRHWEGTHSSQQKAWAFQVPHPSGGAPGSQAFKGEEEDED